MIFNVVTTAVNRVNHLSALAQSLKMAFILSEGYKVNWYIMSQDKLDCLYKSICFGNSINISYMGIEDNGIFCKSKLINKAIKEMAQDYDYLIQLDSDMFINSKLFINIEKANFDWTVLSGEKLTKEATEEVFRYEMQYDNIKKDLQKQPGTERENKTNRYVGNIALKKACLEKYLKITQRETLYDDRFKGWGGEDSVLSMTSTAMAGAGLITKKYIYNAWYH